MLYINFTYTNPHDDTKQNLGLYPDGDVNVIHTLKALKDKLLENISVIDNLIEKSDDITNIHPISNNDVAVWIKSDDVKQELLDNQTIRQYQYDISSDNEMSESNSSDSTDETHTDRLRMLNNVINTNINRYDTESGSDSYSDYGEYDNGLTDYDSIIQLSEYYAGFINQSMSPINNSLR